MSLSDAVRCSTRLNRLFGDYIIFFSLLFFLAVPLGASFDNCSLLRPPSRVFLPSLPLRRSLSLCHQRRFVVRQQRLARVNIVLCLVSLSSSPMYTVHPHAIKWAWLPTASLLPVNPAAHSRKSVWYIKLVPKFFHLSPDSLGWFTHWDPFRQAAKSSNSDFSDQRWDPW